MVACQDYSTLVLQRVLSTPCNVRSSFLRPMTRLSISSRRSCGVLAREGFRCEGLHEEQIEKDVAGLSAVFEWWMDLCYFPEMDSSALCHSTLLCYVIVIVIIKPSSSSWSHHHHPHHHKTITTFIILHLHFFFSAPSSLADTFSPCPRRQSLDGDLLVVIPGFSLLIAALSWSPDTNSALTWCGWYCRL